MALGLLGSGRGAPGPGAAGNATRRSGDGEPARVTNAGIKGMPAFGDGLEHLAQDHVENEGDGDRGRQGEDPGGQHVADRRPLQAGAVGRHGSGNA